MAASGEIYLPKKAWNPKEANWFEYEKGQKWNKEGGDIGLSSLSKVTMEGDMSGKWITFSVTDAIKDMKSGEKVNNGFVILFDAVDHHEYPSSEAEDETKRPRLVVETDGSSIVLSNQLSKSELTTVSTAKSIEVSFPDGTISSVVLYSLKGEFLRSNSVKGSNVALNSTGIAQGRYLLQAMTSEGMITKNIYIGGK